MRTLPLLILLVIGCEIGTDELQPYYDDWSPPSIASISPEGEGGNYGGSTVTISGSGFGTEASKLVVQFGDHSAQIQSVDDGEIVVTVPQGPMTGGEVRVRVATPTGFADTAYTYEVGSDPDQIAYIQVNNYWTSCIGGYSERLQGCNSGNFAFPFFGYTGLDGAAEQLTFSYPRLQTPTQGFLGGQAQGDPETPQWAVLRPTMATYPFATEDLYADLGPDITLTNPGTSNKDEFCPKLATFANTGVVSGKSKCDDGEGYPRDELRFCQRDDVYGVPTNQYRADWPVPYNFFQTKKDEDDQPIEVVLDVPAVGIEGLALQLPESVIFQNTEGITAAGVEGPGAGDYWAGPKAVEIDHCFSDDGGTERLDDTALRFEWTRSEVELTTSDNVEGRTYVRATISAWAFGWLSSYDFPMAAVLTVNDKNDYDKATGKSSLTVPAEILYQFPSLSYPANGLFWIELQRVTEYTVTTDAGQKVVFQYVTGEFLYYDWVNPTDDTCHDCLDEDGDGWTDDDDPDCAGSGVAEVGVSTDACNDGEDNDGDGLADSRDEDCTDGADSDESNCADDLDNDGDGLTDDEDSECAAGGFEHALPACADAADNDADGWSDLDDPDCGSISSEEVGFGATACNDGEDDDGDGLSDAADPECLDAVDADESNCGDGEDNDGDGSTDAADSECEAGGYESA